MKITKRQLRRIIREATRQDDWAAKEKEIAEFDPGSAGDYASQRSPRGPAPTPEAFADQNGLQLEFDNEGQKIIYLDNEQADRLDMPPGVNWDAQNDGGGWVIYTGEYHEEAGIWSDERDYETGFKS